MELGIYGPNRPLWDDADYAAIAESGVRHVLARGDCHQVVFDRLADLGVEVYLQVPDFFARHVWAAPGSRAEQLFVTARERLPRGGWVILDNEPDLGHGDEAQWHAEQWCRWYRALYNTFRFYDHEGRYRLITPALTAPLYTPQRDWWRVGAENVAGHAGIGVHIYWSDYTIGDLDAQLAIMGELNAEDLEVPHYILEFGSSATAYDWAGRRREYAAFSKLVGDYAAVGFAFILNPTPDWAPYAISGEQLVELARAWESA